MELEHFATGMDPDSRQTLIDRFLDGDPQVSNRGNLEPWEASRGKFGAFISYSHADSNFVDSLVAFLESNDVRCWRDIKSMTAGPMEA